MAVSFLYSILLLLLLLIVCSTTTSTTTPPTIISHDSIHEKISKEQRFVVYNSRHLAGECLPICSMDNNSKAPTKSPVTVIELGTIDDGPTTTTTTLYPIEFTEEQSLPTGIPTVFRINGDDKDNECAMYNESCNGCLQHSCAWTDTAGCLTSCDIIADVNCYSSEQYSTATSPKNNNDETSIPIPIITNDEICAIAEDDKSDSILCYGQSDCTSCVDTILVSDRTLTCKWFTTDGGDGGGDGFCGSQQSGLLGPGETTCLSLDNNDDNDNGGGGDDGQAMEACLCGVDDYEWEQSWKCGNDVYVCPTVDTICSTQGSKSSRYYSLSEVQCTTMRSIDIGQKCISLPEYGITNPKSLSNRVCYKNLGSLGVDGMKQDGDSCDTCPSRIKINFEKVVS